MVRTMRDKALEAQKLYGTEVFADPVLHRIVTNTLFTAYMTSGLSRREWALEFVDAYQHLLDGRPAETLPVPSLNRTKIVAEITALLARESESIHQE